MAPPQVRTVSLLNAPAGAVMLDVTANGTAWNYGSWVEFIASAPVGGIQVAGVAMTLDHVATVVGAQTRFTLDIGVGTAGSEATISTWYGELGNPANQGPNHELFPRPISLFAAGSRISLRLACSPAGTSKTIPFALLYYNGLDSTYKSLTALQHYPMPTGGDTTVGNGRVAITPNVSAWVNSSYVLLSPSGGWSDAVALAHLNLSELPAADWEFDIAFTGSHTLVTIESGRPQAAFSGLYLSRVVFNPLITVPANTEVYGRLRKSDTTTTAVYASLNFYTVYPPPAATDPSGGGTVGAGTDPSAGISLCGATMPVAWMTLTPSGTSTVTKYSKVPINQGTADDPRVKTFGSVTRAISNAVSDFSGSSMSIELIDTDRTLRDLEETDSLINARISVYLSTQAGILASSTPRRVFDGVVTDTEPLGGLTFRLQVSDYFASLLEEFSAQHTFPQRVFTTADFPNMGNASDLSNPGNVAMVGKPVPIGYGLLESTPVFVGRRTIGGFDWDEYIVAGHAPSPGGALRIDGDIDGVRSTFSDDMYGVDIIAPGHEPSWTDTTGSSNSYQDYNGNRYFSIFARGPRSDSAIQGQIPFVVRWGGRESTGDGTGTMIDGLLRQILHLFVNDIFGGPYTSGAWLSGPTVPVDLYSRINTASFEAVQTQTASYVTGGFKGAFLLGNDGETATLSDVLSAAARSGGFDYGINKDGQLIATMVDPSATLNRAIVDVTDVIRQTFKSRRRRDQIFNTITYRYGKLYAKPLTNETPDAGTRLPASNAVVANPDWASGDVTTSDATSVTKYGARKFDLTLDLVSDQATADAVAAIRLQTYKNGPTIDTFTERLCGCDTELGSRDTLTHFELPPSAGTARSMRCERHTLDLDALTVEKDYRDLAHVDFSGI